MTDITIDIQTRVPQALKQISSADIDDAVRGPKLAKRLKLLGVRQNISEICIELAQLAPTTWGRKFATFVGGKNDPLDQYIWALPKQE